jgi:protein ImuB
MFATIYLPNFYLQAALRYEPQLRTKPVALIEEHERKPIVIQLNAAAEAAGVRKGMTPSQALARYLQVAIKVRARIQEKSIDEILLQSAFMLSPFVEATAPGIATIQFSDIRQSGQRLAAESSDRSLSSKVARIVDRLHKCQIVAQAGIAPLPDTSFLAAHLARPVLEIDDPKEFLSPLPIETLTLASTG